MWQPNSADFAKKANGATVRLNFTMQVPNQSQNLRGDCSYRLFFIDMP